MDKTFHSQHHQFLPKKTHILWTENKCVPKDKMWWNIILCPSPCSHRPHHHRAKMSSWNVWSVHWFTLKIWSRLSWNMTQPKVNLLVVHFVHGWTSLFSHGSSGLLFWVVSSVSSNISHRNNSAHRQENRGVEQQATYRIEHLFYDSFSFHLSCEKQDHNKYDSQGHSLSQEWNLCVQLRHA